MDIVSSATDSSFCCPSATCAVISLYDGSKELVSITADVRGCDSSPDFENGDDYEAPLTYVFYSFLKK